MSLWPTDFHRSYLQPHELEAAELRVHRMSIMNHEGRLLRMTTLPPTKTIAIARSGGGFLTGIRAACLWLQSTRVPVDLSNGNPNDRLSVAAAARWTAAAVVLRTLSSAVGLF